MDILSVRTVTLASMALALAVGSPAEAQIFRRRFGRQQAQTQTYNQYQPPARVVGNQRFPGNSEFYQDGTVRQNGRVIGRFQPNAQNLTQAGFTPATVQRLTAGTPQPTATNTTGLGAATGAPAAAGTGLGAANTTASDASGAALKAAQDELKAAQEKIASLEGQLAEASGIDRSQRFTSASLVTRLKQKLGEVSQQLSNCENNENEGDAEPETATEAEVATPAEEVASAEVRSVPSKTKTPVFGIPDDNPVLPVQKADAGFRTIGKTVAELGDNKPLGTHVVDTAKGALTAAGQNIRTVVETPARAVNAVISGGDEIIRSDIRAIRKAGAGVVEGRNRAVTGAATTIIGLNQDKSLGAHIRDTAVTSTVTAIGTASAVGGGIIDAGKEKIAGTGRAINDMFWRTLGY